MHVALVGQIGRRGRAQYRGGGDHLLAARQIVSDRQHGGRGVDLGRAPHHHQMNHVVLLLLLLRDHNLVAELLVAHARCCLAIDLGYFVALLEARQSAGRIRVNVLDKVGALVHNLVLVQLKTERIQLALLCVQHDRVRRAHTASTLRPLTSSVMLLLLLHVLLMSGGVGRVRGALVLLE